MDFSVVLITALAALAIIARTRHLWPDAPGSFWLRVLGGLGGLGLALTGAVLLRLDWPAPTGLALAVMGSALALLAAWGADLLWAARKSWLLAAATGVLVGGLGAWWWQAHAVLWVWITLAALASAQATWLLGSPAALSRLAWVRRHLRAWMVLLVLAVLVRIPVPLWPEGFAIISTTQIVLISLAALLWGWGRVGPRIFLLAGLAFSFGLGIELIGSMTGFPFGLYSYDGAPPPSVLGVPLLVPLGWFAMVLSAHLLAGGRPWLTGLLVVAWDLGLEAIMPAKGFWTWQDPNPVWYGAPIQNYLAWFAVGFVISWMYARLGPGLLKETSFGWAYRLEALFLPVGLAMLGFWPAAIVCGLAMNTLAWWGFLARSHGAVQERRVC
jgi:putative membrane protein